MNGVKRIVTASLLVCLAFLSHSQTDSIRVADMSRSDILKLSHDDLLEMNFEDLLLLAQRLGVTIDELLMMQTTVASKTKLTPRETPGIVSIITEQEIKLSGVRDLIDLLRLVPGFDFGYDVQGVIGVGLRGVWAQEGKLLLLIDGQPMNDLSYNNTAFGNHFPVDQIKRVEIIRGPGSAIYGGNAGLGVINIITRSGSDIEGAELSGVYGQMTSSMGRANLNLNTGFKVNGWDISAKGFLGTANRSDQLFTETIDAVDNTLDLSEGGSEISSKHINLGVSNRKLSVRLIADDYKTRYNFFDDEIGAMNGAFNEFRSVLGEVMYSYEVNNKLTITPKLNYRYSRPYYEEGYWRNFHVNRYTGALHFKYDFSRQLSLVSGMEVFNDRGECLSPDGFFYSNNSPRLSINTYAAFAEGIYRFKRVNLIAGGRAEHNSIYGWATAPRFGVTSIFNNFHFKVLLSGSFRSPGIGNIDVATQIEPENCFVSELELGYRINNNMFVTANIFDITINNTIAYFDTGNPESDPGVDWGFKNSGNTGSSGFEVEFRTLYTKGFATVNYSFYTQAFRPVAQIYSVPINSNSALAMPQHKFGMNLNYRPIENISIGPSMVILGRRYGYTATEIHPDGYEVPLATPFKPSYLLNLSINYDNFIRKGISIGISAFDILNQRPPFIQPFDGWFYPYPAPSREILFKLTLTSDALR